MNRPSRAALILFDHFYKNCSTEVSMDRKRNKALSILETEKWYG